MTSISRSRGAAPRRLRTCGSRRREPSTISVTSMLRMSPSRNGLSSGMPWQTTWLIDVQIDLESRIERGPDRRRGRGRIRRRTCRARWCHAGLDPLGEQIERFGGQAARLAHAGEGFWAVQLDVAAAPAARLSGINETALIGPRRGLTSRPGLRSSVPFAARQDKPRRRQPGRLARPVLPRGWPAARRPC